MNAQTDLPQALQHMIDKAISAVQNHPRHELGQARRRAIYDVLRLSPRGEVASLWLALFAAQKVLPIYEHALAAIDEYQAIDESGVSIVQKPRHMLAAAELTLQGTHSWEAMRAARDDFYQDMHLGFDRRVPYLALIAAYEAVCEVTGTVPLSSRISKAVQCDRGTTVYVSSDKWTDEELAGAGANAADAAVNAAYAYAQMPDTREIDYVKVLQFWTWWLREAIPQAWTIAGDAQPAG